ncbi:uncharacterized protein [Centruroides vittatus]|uniref:uncharacterized protein n=1 Tax=Centruroides vittatus TaxID=120091 RepID=UPI00350EDAD9
MIEESFINFIQSHEKTGEGLSTEILNKLEVDKLDIQDCRGQGFDNGANMAGKYKGLNLNLAGVHAASTTPGMITFFGTVQRLFNFFSSSTTCWNILMKCLKLSLKSFSDTRWSSKANAIKALYLQLPEVMKGLQTIANDFSNPEAVSNCGTKLIAGLRSTLQGLRDTGFKQNFQEVQNLAKEMGIEKGFFNKRKKRVKIMEIDETPDEGSNLTPEKLFKIQIYSVFDTLLSQTD